MHGTEQEIDRRLVHWRLESLQAKNPTYSSIPKRIIEHQRFWVSLRNEVIEAMTSGEGETVDFTNKVDVMKPGNVGAVECWLVEVEESMMDILREVTDKSNKAYPSADRVKQLVQAQTSYKDDQRRSNT